MKVMLRLHATLRQYLPRDTGSEGVPLELPAGASVPDALAVLGVPLAHAHLILVNGRHLLKPDLASRHLTDGDQVAVFPAIGGG